jgi:cytochrome c oxidase accessory protein FixG
METVSFRDHVGSIDTQGRRLWIYPRRPSGPYYNARTWVAVFLIMILVGLPFLSFNGHPFILLNIVERKFILFGLAFWPQDFHLLALTLLSVVIFIVLFTAIFGRIWCGWACPQTVFMEIVFRKIEYWIEGDARQQRMLAQAPWTGIKFFKKTVKHIIFFLLSFLIGNLLLAYIIGIPALLQIITDPPLEHWVGLSFMTLFSFIFYGIFSWFREQACIYVCPYGRLQSVLLDKNSLAVMYDHGRGEPRGMLRKTDPTAHGDCVDCKLCVDVCPTGIDIRDGIQMECVNCTACMDACDGVMHKIGRAPKLIRYSTQSRIAEGMPFRITPRIMAYSGVLLVLGTLTSVLLAVRSDVDANIFRAKGPLFQRTDDGYISNLYTADFINKTFDPISVTLRVKDFPARFKLIGRDQLNLPADDITQATFFIELPENNIRQANTRLIIELWDDGKLVEQAETSFLAPTTKPVR